MDGMRRWPRTASTAPLHTLRVGGMRRRRAEAAPRTPSTRRHHIRGGYLINVYVVLRCDLVPALPLARVVVLLLA